ncbi:MAG: ribosome assembly RNA-binding protein YhbY [Gammaproteobacteria bacterium]|jgi:RNA-binding protein|nr:ribosome assembly RNA-binding protein YhbY [Gammaproteobacteria bacterium]
MLTRAFLRNLITKAHPLRPVVLIGSKGLTEQVHNEVEAALMAHELIKVRVNAISRESRQEMMNKMAEFHKANIVQNIGHILVLYRAKEKEKAKK